MRRIIVSILATAMTSVVTMPAMATTLGQLSVTKAKVFDGAGELINSGGGLSSKNFTIDDLNGLEIGIRARNRVDATPPSSTINGNVYSVLPGSTPFEFDYQFSPKTTDSSTQDYYLELKIDTDPSSATNFVTLDGPVFGGWDQSDGYFTNGNVKGGTGAWSNSSTPYIVGNSAQLTWYDSSYNPNTPGDYTLVFTAYGASAGQKTGGALVSTTAVAHVVPVPATAWGVLLGLGYVGIGVWRRRKLSA